MSAPRTWKIGDLSRQTGLSVPVLRAWENRYGIVSPARTDGGTRRYADADLRRLEAMKSLISRGFPASVAAKTILASEGSEMAPVAVPQVVDRAPDAWADDFMRAVQAFDDDAAQAAIDGAVAGVALDTLLEDVVCVILRRLGDGWQEGRLSVAHEHFASGVLRGRMLGLGRGWGSGIGPRAVLAAPPGEQHDLGLIIFGLALRHRGWRIVFLGADTPMESLTHACDSLAPEMVVVAVSDAQRLSPHVAPLRAIAARRPLVVAGPITAADVRRTGATHATGGPVESARQLCRIHLQTMEKEAS